MERQLIDIGASEESVNLVVFYGVKLPSKAALRIEQMRASIPNFRHP